MASYSKEASGSEVTLALSDPLSTRKTTSPCHQTSKPVRLLSLDGGGIRGISSLAILRDIMNQVNRGREKHLQPWQVFDMIGGTSTGGIIAVMLGRLRMTLDECHEAYSKLAKTIFKPKRCRFNIIGRGLDALSASERYDSQKFEEVVKAIIAKRKGSSTELLYSPEDDGCKVQVTPESALSPALTSHSFVTTVSADDNKLALLRSYQNPQDPDDPLNQFELWEALRATSAATTYFKEFRRGDTGWVDGAFLANNPVFHVHSEASDLWPSRSVFLLSIGTGTKPNVPLRGHALQVARTLTRLVTETEQTWTGFARGNTDIAEAGMLFRYSARGAGAVDLGDYRRLSEVESTTRRWLREHSVEKDVGACARRLAEIEATDYDKIDREKREREARLRESLSKEEKECLKTLHHTAPGYESQRLNVDKPVPGTCEWFLSHPEFVNWMDTPASMLWLTANPGCGKSVLSGHLVDSLGRTYGEDAIVCSFFFRAGEETRRMAHQALCGLLHQIFTADPSLTKLAIPAFSRKDRTSFVADVEGLWEILVATAKQLGKRKLICVVDALDECQEGPRNRLCDLLSATFGPAGKETCPSNIKFLITSRPWPSLENRLRPFVGFRFRGEDASHSLQQDLDEMVRYRVDRLQQDFSLSDDSASWLCRKLCHGADQTFLWVSLVLDKVADMPSRKLSAIKELLANLPVGLDSLYESALDSFEHPEQSIKLLEFLVAAERELTIDEINIALNITDQVQSINQLHDEMEPDMEWTVKRMGGFFVRISNSVVSLVHHTAREFLCNKASEEAKDSAGRPSLSLKSANARLGASCARFLVLRGLPAGPRSVSFQNDVRLASNHAYLESCPVWTRRFLEYSAEHWSKHLNEEMFDPQSSLWPIVTRLCSPGSLTFNVWWPFYVSLGWTFCLSTRLNNDGDGKSPCQVGVDRYPAHYAAYSGSSAIVLAMMRAGACRAEEKNDDGASLLVVASAAVKRNTRLVAMLLHGLDTQGDSSSVIGGALLVALFRQHRETVRILASTGIDVNREYCIRRDRTLEKAFPVDVLLAMPVAFEYSPMLEMLCNNGLIVSDAHLAAAATKGCSDALAILLDNDRRPMEDRLPGLREAFGLASENGWPECRELMLRRFEDLKDVDISVGLKAASDRHDPNALHTILGLGAQDDGSALQSACETANEETARQLLQAQSYSTHQLNLALEAYFNSVNDANMRRYQVRRVESAIQSRTSLYQTFKFTSTFGLTMEGKYAVLDMLSKRGARVSESLFIKAFAVVVPMDEDFAAYLLDNMGTLQDGCGLRSGDFLTLACLWGRERLVRGMLERPDSEILGDGIGISPIDAAEASGNAALVEFLLSRNASTHAAITTAPKERDDSKAALMIDEEVGLWWPIVRPRER